MWDSEGPKCGVAGCTFSKLSEEELGLRCHNPVDTIVDTIQSMIDLDLVTVRHPNTHPTQHPAVRTDSGSKRA